jgi:Tol biopolymer transport system component
VGVEDVHAERPVALARISAPRRPAADDLLVPGIVDEGSPLIRVLDVASRTSSAWSVSGTMPAWSPDGTRIAYRKATTELSIVTPDGIAQPMPTLFVYDVSGWSPDSRWVIVGRSPWTALFDPTIGTELPLTFGSNMTATSMK